MKCGDLNNAGLLNKYSDISKRNGVRIKEVDGSPDQVEMRTSGWHISE